MRANFSFGEGRMQLKMNKIGSIFLRTWAIVGLILANSSIASAQFSAAPLLHTSTNAPILLIVNSSAPNKFGSYLGEILRAEGLNAFDQVELDSLTSTQLAQYDVAILAETPLSATHALTLTNFVSGGGALLAMRPDSKIAGIFGLGANEGTQSDGYLQIQTGASFNGQTPGSGLTAETLQIHGVTDQYTTTADAVTLAQLYTTAITITSYPAVVAANYGSGQAVAFTYDLVSNIVYTRQGNPVNANLDVDGDGYTRTVDLFQTADPTTPWINRDKIPIPQADEQQRFFARLVQQMVGRNHPMPQLWYFPETAKTMLILNSDAHWNNINDYVDLIADVSAHQGRVTVYLFDMGALNGNYWDWPSDTDLQLWETEGHTFGIHPWRASYTMTMMTAFSGNDTWFLSTYTIPRSRTVRTHYIEWEGWTGTADAAAMHNIAMDTSFYHWGAWLQKPDLTWPHGYITGSGLPMKFIREDGTLTSVYQQLTELADDQLFTSQGGLEGLTTGAQAVALSKGLIDASLAGNYSALVEHHHVDNYSSNPALQDWLAGSIDYAHSKNVPVWNADQWLSFTETRHDANYTDIAWDNISSTLSFNIVMTATPGLTLTTMLPRSYGGEALTAVKVDGVRSNFITETVKSTNVAFVSVPAGNHSVRAFYGNHTTAISLLTLAAQSDENSWLPIAVALLLSGVLVWRWRKFTLRTAP
jgi:hypothetical protein